MPKIEREIKIKQPNPIKEVMAKQKRAEESGVVNLSRDGQDDWERGG